jgi:eukaryotic-like serine/threonine-protein kinase
MSEPNDPSQTVVKEPSPDDPSGVEDIRSRLRRREVVTFGPYHILKELGAGAMGVVFLATDTRLDRPVALKVMLPVGGREEQEGGRSLAKDRFIREARAAAKLTHDHVVTIYETGDCNGVLYTAMQLLAGQSLDDSLKKNGSLTIPQILRVAKETALALVAAHALGLVHRDIKPGNLWLEAPSGRVKVLDFGLARPVDTDVKYTKSGAVVGTPAYMSLEQARGEKVDGRTDLFSLGATLYQLCTGQLPFQGLTVMAVLIAVATSDPKPVRELNPNVPEPLAELIHGLLAKDVDARIQTAQEVLECVDLILRGPPSETATPELDDALREERIADWISIVAPVVVLFGILSIFALVHYLTKP